MSNAFVEASSEQPLPHAPLPEKPPRSLALDALRGLAILAMYLSGIVPWTGLPAWMYHGQEPPPSHEFNPNHPGITWVDLIFPFFLFAMGAAIPLAQSKAIERGIPIWRLLLNALSRGALLVAFALYVQHVRPYQQTDDPTTHTWLLALLTFALAFPLFARLPKKMPVWAVAIVRLAGLAAAWFVVAHVRYLDGFGFDKGRSDIIILVLANMAFAATIVWLLSRSSDKVRIAVMAVGVGLELTQNQPGTIAHALWRINDTIRPLTGGREVAWAFNPEFLPYLIVLMPGTIVGDELLRRPKAPLSWTPPRLTAIAVSTFLMIPAALVLFYNRINPFWIAPLVVVVLYGVARPQSDADERLRRLVCWAVVWFLLGCLFEPFQGGIKKDPPTFGYMLAAPGLATLTLVSFMSIEAMRPKTLAMRFIGTVGQNPMLAYLAITNLIAPVWALAGGPTVEGWLPGPYLGMVRASIQVLLLGLMVVGFTKAKIYLRA